MSQMADFTLEKLDFERLYDEAEKAGRVGECPLCETPGLLLCWCGVCLKYCHGDYFHEPVSDHPYDRPDFIEVKATMAEFMLAEGELVAGFLAEQLAPFVERLEVAGSIRRKRPAVHDVDLVCIPRVRSVEVGLPGLGPTEDVNLVAAFLHSRLPWLVEVHAQGQKLWRITVRCRGLEMPVDVYFATPATWPTLLLIRTGSREHNIKLCQRAQRLGLQLKADGSGLLDVSDGRFLPVSSEEDIFAHLGLAYVEPEGRE